MRLTLLPRQGRRGDAAAAREAGFDGYMAPPVEKQALQEALRLVLAGDGSFDCDGGGAESAENPESADLVTRHTVRETGMQGFRVLLVEDNGVNRLLMRTLVERAGFLYAEAEDGPSALEALRREPIDLILMDIQLPGMDGYELTRYIRRGEAGEEAARLPVIAVTANAAAEDRREGFAAGVDDYLPKPVDGDKLYEYLAYYAEMRGNEAGVGGMPRDWNRPDLERRLQGDKQILREMLDGFLADVPPRMERIRQAWARGDLAALQEETHSLKGLSGTVGAEALHAEARGINDLLKKGGGLPPEFQLNRLEKHWEKVQVVVETFLEEAAWEGGG